jgi:hypothetical protein
MNHTTTTKKNLAITVAMLAAITAALTGTIAISSNIQQTAAAYNTNSTDPNPSNNNNNNSTDREKSTTDFKSKEKDKNNCSGSANCCNIASQTAVDLNRAIIVPLSIDEEPPPPPAPLCPIEA